MSAEDHAETVSPRSYRTSIVSRDKCSLARCIQFAELGLRNIFGVKNLTIIERFYLKHCVIRIAESIDMQLKEHEEGKLRAPTIPSLSAESAWLWVNKCYDVPIPTINRDIRQGFGCATPKFCAWLQLERLRRQLL